MGLHTKELFQIQWKKLLSSAQHLHFHKGQVIYYEGHTPYGIYWIQEGAVRFSRQSPCEEEHALQLPGYVRDHWLGFREFLANEGHCCTCIADTDCEVLFVNRTLLQESIKKDSSNNR